MHYTTKIWDVLDSNKRSYLRLWKLSCPSCYEGSLRLKRLGNVMEDIFLQTEKKNKITKLKLLQLA